MNIFLDNPDGLSLVTNHLYENNIKLKFKVDKELYKYKLTRRETTSKTQLRLYYRSIETLKYNLTIKLSINLLTFRMRQFARWFGYMWNNPSLCHKTFTRLSKKYPYNKTHFLRKYKLKI